MMHFEMQPGMVYEYPLWRIGLLLVILTAFRAVSVELVH